MAASRALALRRRQLAELHQDLPFALGGSRLGRGQLRLQVGQPLLLGLEGGIGCDRVWTIRLDRSTAFVPQGENDRSGSHQHDYEYVDRHTPLVSGPVTNDVPAPYPDLAKHFPLRQRL